MEQDLAQQVERLPDRRPPASPDDIAAAERALGPLPEDYKRFLGLANGFEGSVSENWYLHLYPAAELAVVNEAYEVSRQRPGLVLFGTNLGGEAFFFDMTRPGPPVLMIAWISDWHEDAFPCGDSFSDFLAKALAGWSPFGRESFGGG